MILITGATGTIGRHLVELLAHRGDVRALVRGDAELPPGVEPVHGDLARPETLPPALAGTERLFLLTPFGEGHERLEHNALDAAQAAGVARVVKLSVAMAPWPIALAAGHREIEERLAAAPFAATVVRAESFSSNLLAQAPDQLVFPAREGRYGYVDPADVAAVAAAALTAEVAPRGTLTVTGPEHVTHPQVADRLGAAYLEVPGPAWAASAREAGVPAFVAAALAELFEAMAVRGPIPLTDTVERLTGRAPTRVEEVVARSRALAR